MYKKRPRSAIQNRNSKRIKQDIQPNFSIELEGIPLLKKFSSASNHENMVEQLEEFHGAAFVLKFEEGVAKVIPYISSGERTRFTSPKFTLLQEFLKYQLINSGVLPFLSQVPLNGEIILINTQVLKTNNEDAENFHNDGLLFNIIRYEKPNEDTVLGTTILFVDQRKALAHRYMGTENFKKQRELETNDEDMDEETEDENYKVFMSNNDGRFHEEYAGPALTLVQDNILKMYTENPELKETVLRGLYNSGDSLVINDMLVKHSSLKIEPRDETNKITIHMEAGRDVILETVSICDRQIEPTPEDLQNRQIIGFVFLKNISVESSNFTLVDRHAIEIPLVDLPYSEDTLQLDIETYHNFLQALKTTHSDNCGIFEIVTRTDTRTATRTATRTVRKTFRLHGGKTKRKGSKKSKRKRKYK